mmetsp:Transcript_18151/g.49795  ORF Transcript_18151/g.49795 Transcript_18151/m.49795 type:complete len:243 (-) Transcript_18151:37-765(-)
MRSHSACRSWSCERSSDTASCPPAANLFNSSSVWNNAALKLKSVSTMTDMCLEQFSSMVFNTCDESLDRFVCMLTDRDNVPPSTWTSESSSQVSVCSLPLLYIRGAAASAAIVINSLTFRARFSNSSMPMSQPSSVSCVEVLSTATTTGPSTLFARRRTPPIAAGDAEFRAALLGKARPAPSWSCFETCWAKQGRGVTGMPRPGCCCIGRLTTLVRRIVARIAATGGSARTEPGSADVQHKR